MERLDQYDVKPKAMLNYLAHCGWHFNKSMCKFALKHLPKKSNILEKSKIDSMLQSHNITLQNNQLYDYIYVANYAMSVYYGSALIDEKSLVNYIKDTIDTEQDDMIFTQWYAKMCRLGIPIDWENMI